MNITAEEYETFSQEKKDVCSGAIVDPSTFAIVYCIDETDYNNEYYLRFCRRTYRLRNKNDVYDYWTKRIA